MQFVAPGPRPIAAGCRICTCALVTRKISCVARNGCFFWSSKCAPVPEHVVLVKSAYHSFACNRELCKDNKPVPAKEQGFIMKEGQAQGALKTAISYTLNAFGALQRFAFDARLEIDNNPVERCMRLIALAKKNSIGAGLHDAEKAWAICFSLIESARMNRVNPRAYMTWVVGETERTRGQIEYSSLMPWHCPVGRLDN